LEYLGITGGKEDKL